MQNSRNKLFFMIVILSVVICVSMVAILKTLLKNDLKTNVKYRRPSVISSIKRANILSKDEQILCMDKLENHLSFNKAAFMAASPEKKEFILDKLEEIFEHKKFSRKEFVDYLEEIGADKYTDEEVSPDKIELDKFDDPERKMIIKEIIDENLLSDYFFLEEVRVRVLADGLNPSVINLKKFIGSVDEFSRNGESGVEKKFNGYLKYSPTVEGKDVYLTLDMKMLEEVENLCSRGMKGLHVFVLNQMTGELLTIYDNDIDITDINNGVKEYDEVYSIPSEDIQLFVSKVTAVLGMIETDPTLLEEYYCREHGVVDVFHCINCQDAFNNMLENYKSQQEEFNKFIVKSLLLKGDVERKGSALLYLAYLALSQHNKIPTLDYLEHNYVCKIGDDVSLPKEFEINYIDKKSIGLSQLSKDFLENVFSEPVDSRFYAFAPNSKYIVLAYNSNGVDMKLMSRLEEKLKTYKVIQK